MSVNPVHLCLQTFVTHHHVMAESQICGMRQLFLLVLIHFLTAAPGKLTEPSNHFTMTSVTPRSRRPGRGTQTLFKSDSPPRALAAFNRTAAAPAPFTSTVTRLLKLQLCRFRKAASWCIEACQCCSVRQLGLVQAARDAAQLLTCIVPRVQRGLREHCGTKRVISTGINAKL